MSDSPVNRRVAVAEETVSDDLAPRLGRATKFAIFDVRGDRVKGPIYRVRHQDPGGNCDGHDELTALLEDCSAVIVKSAGQRMADRLRKIGVDVVISDETGKPVQMVSRYVSGVLHRLPPVDPTAADQGGRD